MTKNYEGLDDIYLDLFDQLRPPERISVSTAMERYVHLNNPGSYIGPYRTEFAPYMQEPMDTLNSRLFVGEVFCGPAQSGKALLLDTPLATPNGWTTMGEVKRGEYVYGDDGKPTKVVTVSDVMQDHDCYRVTFDDGSQVGADGDHWWTVYDNKRERHNIWTTKEILDSGIKYRENRFRFSVANAKAIECDEKQLPVDPYTLGAWLGDGNSFSSWITMHRDDAHIARKIEDAGYHVSINDTGNPNVVTVKIDAVSEVADRFDTIKTALTDLGVLCGNHRSVKGNFKHIPLIYLRASIEQRMELLRGLMDTDGWISTDICGYSSSSVQLAKDFYELATSLGYKVRKRNKKTSYKYKGEMLEGKLAYTFTFVAYAEDESPFSLPRKASQLPSRFDGSRPTYPGSRRIVSIEPITSAPVRCIGVDNASHLYLAGRQMVPTHNTEGLCLGWLAYSVRVDPMDLIIYSPTMQAGRDFSMRRVDRLHRNSPEIGQVLMRNRDSDNKFDKHYKTGVMLSLSWPTVTEFAGKPIGRVALTDYDRMDDDIGGDGNPFDLGSKRTTSFGSFAMTLAESSPSRPIENLKWVRQSPHEAPPCKGVLGLYNRGDRRRWYWPCPKCGSYFEGKWSMMEWDTKRTILESAETVRMIAPCCGYSILPFERQGMQEYGMWLRDGERIDPETGMRTGTPVRSNIASFWMFGVAAAFTTWKNLVISYLNAHQAYERTASEDELKKFFNTDLAEPYVSKAAEIERLPEVLKARAETMPVLEIDEPERVSRLSNRTYAFMPMVPAGVRFLVASVDVQGNMFVVQVHGILAGMPYDVIVVDRFSIRKSRRLDLQGEALWVKPGTYLEDWDEITSEVLERTYPLSDGSTRRMSIRFTVCDSGGASYTTTFAYNYYRNLKRAGKAGRFHLVKGDRLVSRPRTQITFPDSNQRDKLAAARGDVPVMLLNSNVLKDAVVTRLECVETGKGMFRFPDWLPDWWFAEMCAETRTEKGWEASNHKRNEGWDLSYYCLAACASVLLRVEQFNWLAPPGWAQVWDLNDLVFSVDEGKPFVKKEESFFDFSAYGASLA